MLTKLTEEIELFQTNNIVKNIEILVCKDHTETPIKKELLLKEVNSPYYVFLDKTDDVHDTFIQALILKWSKPMKNAIIMACDRKYFKSCLTLITTLFNHHHIDIIYVLILS